MRAGQLSTGCLEMSFEQQLERSPRAAASLDLHASNDMHKQQTNDDDNDAISIPQNGGQPASLAPTVLADSVRWAVVGDQWACRRGPVITFIHMPIDLLGHINNMPLIGRRALLGRSD